MKPHFKEIDADHNGSIDIEETKKFMKSININPAFAPLVLEICDTNKDGQISFDEFGPYFTLLSQLDENPSCIYKYIFDKFYTDHNGLLDKNEVRGLFKLFSDAEWTNDEIEAIIEKEDKDNDGNLNFAEMCEMLANDK